MKRSPRTNRPLGPAFPSLAAPPRDRRTLCLIVALAALAGAPPVTLAQHGGHGGHPLMPTQQLVLSLQFEADGRAQTVETPIQPPSTMTACDFDQPIRLPAPWPAVSAVRFLPRAELRQSVEPAAAGQEGEPALLLEIKGTKQRYERWLLARDPQRNGMLSFIGTWRYMAVEKRAERDELYRQFETELTRPPTLHVAARDGSWSHSFPANVGATHALKEAGCTARIKAFLPDFAISQEGGQPVSRSEQRLNPALLVEVQCGDTRTERWLFAKFGSFEMHDQADWPFDARFDCPLAKKSDAPDFVLLTLLPDTHEVWTRYHGQTRGARFEVNKPVEIPGANYTFTPLRYEQKGRLLEQYVPAEGKGGTPALQLRTVDKRGQPLPVWLPLGQEKPIELGPGRLTAALTLQDANAKPQEKP